MKIFEHLTKIEDLNYYEASSIQAGDPLTIRVVDPKTIKVFYKRRLVGYLPKTIAQEMTLLIDQNSFVEVECVEVSNFEVYVLVRGFYLVRGRFALGE